MDTPGVMENLSEHERIMLAARDARVGVIANGFPWLDFEIDRTEVGAIADDFQISHHDVLERVCVLRLLSDVERAAYGEA